MFMDSGGRLAGKVVFITGAARGQGRSHAVRLAAEGADVIALDIVEQIDSTKRFYPSATSADVDETIAAVRELGRRIVFVRGDVRDLSAVESAVAAGVAEFGRLDVVVANAGIFMLGDPAHETAPSDWSDTIDVNLTGVWNTARACAPYLIAQQAGSIIFVNSSSGLKGPANIAAYAASKHGALGLMRSMANELGAYNIRVNTIHPTVVNTPMAVNEATFRLFRPDLERPSADDAAPAYRALHVLPVAWVEPIDVSNAVLFLASDESRYITGTELKVDAGVTIK